MWDDDDFEIADPNAAPGEGYVAAIIFGLIAFIAAIYFQNF